MNMEYLSIEPAFPEEDSCIILCGDNDFMPATSVTIQSIIDSSGKSNFYDIVIFHENVSSYIQKLICGMANGRDRVSIRFVNIRKFLGEASFYVENRKTITMETYFRLFAPWILSNAYKRAVYIDGDMLVLDDIASLLKTELHGNLIGAVRDYWGICNCYIPGDPRRAYREKIGLPDIDNYVIAATTVFNLPRFRKEFTLQQILALCTQYNWDQHDQDVLNVICKNSIFYLDPKWGFMRDYGNNHFLPAALLKELEGVENHIAILHFGGIRKPWKSAYEYRAMDFWRCAERTPFFSYLLGLVRSNEYRTYIAYSLSNGRLETVYTPTDVQLYYKNTLLSKLSQGNTTYRIISITDNRLYIEGFVSFFGVPKETAVSVFININGLDIPVSSQRREDGWIKKYNERLYTHRGEAFTFEYELNEASSYKIKITCKCDNFYLEKSNLSFGKFSPFNRSFRENYYFSNSWLVKTDLHTLTISKCTSVRRWKQEFKFCKELWCLGTTEGRKAAIVRPLSQFVKLFVRKPIWIVSDRLARADENGEAFFRFLREKKREQVHAVFVIKKDTPDYKRLKQYGTVVPAYSYRHKFLHLLASYSISSQTDEVFRNPFLGYGHLYQDILSDIKFVFLQHGIISNDLSGWLHRKRNQLAGFVTTTPKEYDSVLQGNYGYTEKEVWLTGLPRFDLLQNTSKRLITVLPTWRRYLAVQQNHETGIWDLVPDFSSSKYATFYRSLLSHQRLLKKAAEMGYIIQFKIHPSFLSHEGEFNFSSDVRIVDKETSYRMIYSESELIITDYSSAIYDFLYLRKPIIYAQFDTEEFFSGKHIYEKGSFDYERDGFGEVEYDLESTVDRIIEYMQNGCKLKDKYRERIDRFFAFNDQNNCQRVYEKIMELEGGQ